MKRYSVQTIGMLAILMVSGCGPLPGTKPTITATVRRSNGVVPFSTANPDVLCWPGSVCIYNIDFNPNDATAAGVHPGKACPWRSMTSSTSDPRLGHFQIQHAPWVQWGRAELAADQLRRRCSRRGVAQPSTQPTLRCHRRGTRGGGKFAMVAVVWRGPFPDREPGWNGDLQGSGFPAGASSVGGVAVRVRIAKERSGASGRSSRR